MQVRNIAERHRHQRRHQMPRELLLERLRSSKLRVVTDSTHQGGINNATVRSFATRLAFFPGVLVAYLVRRKRSAFWGETAVSVVRARSRQSVQGRVLRRIDKSDGLIRPAELTAFAFALVARLLAFLYVLRVSAFHRALRTLMRILAPRETAAPATTVVRVIGATAIVSAAAKDAYVGETTHFSLAQKPFVARIMLKQVLCFLFFFFLHLQPCLAFHFHMVARDSAGGPQVKSNACGNARRADCVNET